jgi:hypothetical protein
VLRYCRAVRPRWEQPAEGPPKLRAHALPRAAELFVDAPLHLTASAHNTGGATTGISIGVGGTPVSERMIALERAELVLGGPPGSRRDDLHRIEAPFADAVRSDGANIRVAQFPAATLHAGPAMSREAAMAEDMTLLTQLLSVGSVHVNVHGRGLAEGEGALEIAIIPDAHAQAAFVQRISVRVRRAGRRPLFASPDLDPHLLQPLEDKTTLVGLVTLDVPDTEAAALAAAALERWLPMLDGDVAVGIHHRDHERRPTIRERVDLATLRAELASEIQVSISTPGRADNGFAYGRSLRTTYEPSPDDPELPTLLVYTSRPDSAARPLVLSIIGDLFARGRGTQALVGRWGRPAGLDWTPYEIACRVHERVLQRSWQTSHLRAVIEGVVWLGPALVEKIDRGALAAAADVTPLDHGLRVAVADVPAVERALEPVLRLRR